MPDDIEYVDLPPTEWVNFRLPYIYTGEQMFQFAEACIRLDRLRQKAADSEVSRRWPWNELQRQADKTASNSPA